MVHDDDATGATVAAPDPITALGIVCRFAGYEETPYLLHHATYRGHAGDITLAIAIYPDERAFFTLSTPKAVISLPWGIDLAEAITNAIADIRIAYPRIARDLYRETEFCVGCDGSGWNEREDIGAVHHDDDGIPIFPVSPCGVCLLPSEEGCDD